MKTIHFPVQRTRMSHVMRDLFDDDLFENFTRKRRLPGINISEDKDRWVIEMNVPGLKKEDIKIEVKEDELLISGEVQESKEEEDRAYNYREFNLESFKRSFDLPKGRFDEEGIEAGYDNGILTISLPKQEHAKQSGVREVLIK